MHAGPYLAGGQGGQLPPLSPPPPCSNNTDTRNKQGALAIICHYCASDRSKRARFQVYSLDLAIYIQDSTRYVTCVHIAYAHAHDVFASRKLRLPPQV